MSKEDFEGYVGGSGSGIKVLDDISDAGNWLGGIFVVAGILFFVMRRK